MSRIGKLPIAIPNGVQVEVRDREVRVKGAQGELTQALPPGIRVEVQGGEIHVLRGGDEPLERSMHGLGRTLVANAVRGVTQKYEKKLEIVGIGYRATPGKDTVTFNLGYSHAIDFPVPKGIEVTVDKQTQVTVRGIDKQLVGQVAAEIRDLKRPDVYKQKGIRYEGERLRKKVGKAGA
jgi:large subunit ribosomal protein L6